MPTPEQMKEGDQAMDIENLEELITYVYTEKDISLNPSEQELAKLRRIMRIMVRFYVKGTETKKEQVDMVNEELKKLETDLKMLDEQAEVLQQFPPFHPKRREYESNLEIEKQGLLQQRTSLEV
jgi:hypothetical protein